ncbi:MAG: branched-chain amino acid ABC transporter permease [Rhodanobacter sp.]
MPSLPLLLSQVFNGLAYGSLLALIAAGLTIIYGTLGVINFAHGALFLVGAYVGSTVFAATGSFVLAIAAGALFTALVGIVLERLIVRRFYHRPAEDQILVTFGVAIVIAELIRATYGGIAKSVPTPDWGQGVVSIGSLIYPLYRVEALGIAVATLIVLYFLLYHTRLGLVVRAGIEDSLMVNLLGINVQRAFLVVFGVGAMAAGFAGVVDSPILSLDPDMGMRILIESFVVVVIGGIGSFPGAVLGGLIAGVILSVTSVFDPQYSQVVLFAVMALVLLLRPRGLMGVEGRA